MVSNPSDRDVDALVQRILAEANDPRSPTVDRLRARVEALTPAKQVVVDERLRHEKLPIFAYGAPQPPPGLDRGLPVPSA